jgi:hypothetical protein
MRAAILCFSIRACCFSTGVRLEMMARAACRCKGGSRLPPGSQQAKKPPPHTKARGRNKEPVLDFAAARSLLAWRYAATTWWAWCRPTRAARSLGTDTSALRSTRNGSQLHVAHSPARRCLPRRREACLFDDTASQSHLMYSIHPASVYAIRRNVQQLSPKPAGASCDVM